MSGGLSAKVRGLRNQETFCGGGCGDDELNALVGSLNRFEEDCEEALKSIGMGDAEDPADVVAGSDWARYQNLREDYRLRLQQEEAFFSSGGERTRAEPVEKELRNVGELDQELAGLERCQLDVSCAFVKGARATSADVQSGLKEIASHEQRIDSLGKEASRLSRIASRIAPSGADMHEWTLPRLRASADVLASHEKEFAATQSWIQQAKIQLAAKRQSLKALESVCKESELKLSAFRQMLVRCVQKAELLSLGSRGVELAAFVRLPSSMAIEEVCQLDVASVRREVDSIGDQCLRRFKGEVQIVRSVQPPYSGFDLTSVNMTDLMPPFVRVGTCEAVSRKGCAVYAPARLKFPLPSAVSCAGQLEMSSALLRLAFALPQGMLKIKVLDPDSYGSCVRDVSRLASLGVMEILTETEEIGATLRDIEAYAADLVRDGKLSGAVGDWRSYNREHPEDLLPYHVLVVPSCEGLTEEQTAMLTRLLRRGREIGVCAFCLRDARERFAAEDWAPPGVKADELASGAAIERMMDVLEEAQALAQSAPPKAKRGFDDILSAGQSVWTQNAAKSVVAVLGQDESEGAVELCLGGENNHVLLGGTTGSGKSNLIHVLIHSLCHRYSPDEVRLFLLDYKDGLEFGKYVEDGRAWLPHIESVSVHNDPAYALSMLDAVQRECLARKRQFAGARNYAEFRAAGGKMPRIVIIIDEFHKLFETSDAEGMSARLMQVLKQGRAYGVHLILATQTLASSDIPNLAGMLGQIPIRLALRGSDGDRILEPDNLAATTIAIPRCVFNDQFGRTRGNRVFNVPEAVFDGRFKTQIAAARKTCDSRGGGSVFNGLQMPRLTRKAFAARLSEERNRLKGGDVRFVLGEENVFRSKALQIALDASPTAHVLVAAPAGDAPMDDAGLLYREEVVANLMCEILLGLEGDPNVSAIYYNPQGEASARQDVLLRVAVCPSDATEAELADALRGLAASPAKSRVLVVDGYEKARFLHPDDSPRGYLEPGESDGASARDLFFKAFQNSDGDLPFHVVLVVRNFRYAADALFYDGGSGVNILKKFTHRVSIDLPLDDVQTLFPAHLRRDVAGKALYGSTQSDAVTPFLPYEIQERRA